MEKKDLKKLSDPSFHKSLGIELKWRVGDRDRASGGNAIFPYYDAEQCREILDAAVGSENWYNEYRQVGKYLFCTIGIKIGDNWVEKADAGGPRESRKDLKGLDLEAWEAKTAASSAFVRAAKAWGIGRHIDLLPKIILKTANGLAINPQTGEKMNPEDLSNYCNQISKAEGYLYAIYRQRKEMFDSNPDAVELMKRMKELLTE